MKYVIAIALAITAAQSIAQVRTVCQRNAIGQIVCVSTVAKGF